MLLRYFGLNEDPFGVTPNPRYLYQSNTHREALASLKYGYYSNRGFTAMIAQPGMGKTTLLFRFLEDIGESARSVFLFYLDAQCGPRELVSYILRDIGIVPAQSVVEMHEQLNDALITEARAGRKFVIVIDEAQNLSDATLEKLRLLTNFETPQAKLLQVVLAGQPQLADKLMQPSLVQLRQRISTYCRLELFTAEDTSAYISHRLKLAGYSGAPLFAGEALKLIAEASAGIPRSINNLCFNSLSLCCALNRKQVDSGMVAEVMVDLQLMPKASQVPAPTLEIATEKPLEVERRKLAAGLPRRRSLSAAALLALAALGVFGFAAPYTNKFDMMRGGNTVDAKTLPALSPKPTTASAEKDAAFGTDLNASTLADGVVSHHNPQHVALQLPVEIHLQSLNEVDAAAAKLMDPSQAKAEHNSLHPALPFEAATEAATLPANVKPLFAWTPTPAAANDGSAVIPGSSAKTSTFEITVQPHQTLQEISMQNLGDFDAGLLHRIRALNPNLIDPNRIETGQKIKLPRAPEVKLARNTIPPANVRTLP